MDLLLGHLDEDMAWRIKEVHQFKTAVERAKGKNIDAHIRAGIAMLYAHWEGFVKGAANAYVNYVSYKANQNSELKPCFVALGMKNKLASANSSSKSEVVIEAVTYLLDELNRPIRLPRSEAISAESNLSSLVFLNITGWIGIDPTPYSTRFTLIDTTLLENRNRIAHGEYLSVNAERFYELTDEILEMLRWFKTDIENAVVQNSFLKAW
ncbi:MAG TPA: MAE_28990/MAE_18760 family HEPN-like nuclease [Paraburkholderia sp.]|nr:MAE_28990/MAE_18760 family HEPN-like nuclease [Paraburkholderia sp.]